jgi:short-subunit dehydrogenase
MTNDVFKENVVIVTGASSGIGEALAYRLADQGAWLSLAARNISRLEAVADQCRSRGGRALVVPTDVCEQDACKRLVNQTVDKYNRIDTLINNAGVTMWARFEELQTLEPLKTIMQTNYFGSVYCTHYALPYLKQTHGRIVAISSLTGKTGVPTRSGYAASKHAMVGFFDSLRIEISKYDVSVTIIYPDFVKAETRVRAFGPDGKPLGKSPVREGEVMTAEECARIIIKTAAGRKREQVMGFRGKVGQWIKLIAPGVIDSIALRAIESGK